MQTKKEIWEAKKIFYESDALTKRSFIISISTLVILISKLNLQK
jgi:hypothetical protein